ncbi:MAG TPA: Ig-like domain-containing protein [Candidatus Eisenbacteria bacterium]|jgi:hypothetical protein|nr:Ig-like domain-containing protein [Candidatus Eisenbacteria bacterium]
MKRFHKHYGALGLAAMMSLALAGSAGAQTDTTAPAVSGITPTSAQVNVAATYSATYSDAVGVTGCELYVNGINQGAMTLDGSTSGTATRSYTLEATGDYTFQARCRDAMNNIGQGALTTVSAPSDTVLPTVGAVSPTTAQVNTATTFSASFSDNVAVTACDLYVNGTNQGSMSLAGSASGIASKQYTLTAAGSYTFQARCRDAANNIGLGAATTVTTVPPGPDNSAPSVGSITPTTANVFAATTFSAAYSDNVGVTGCDLWVNGANQGSMTLSGSASGLASKQYTIGASGTYNFQARCTDAAGNVGLGASTTVTTIPPGPVDTLAPAVSAISPTTATVNVATTFSASYSDSNGVTSCNLYLNGNNQGVMATSGFSSGTASMNLTLSAAGTHTLQAKCLDAAGNLGTGAATSVVAGPPFPPTGDTTAPTAPTNLMLVSGINDNRAVFQWSASSDNVGIAGYEIQVDGGTFLTMGNFLNTQLTLTNGTHTVGVRAFDAAGNRSATTSINVSINAGPAPIGATGFSVEQMDADAGVIVQASRQALIDQMQRSCEFTDAEARGMVTGTLGTISNSTVLQTIVNFTACGSITTLHLGAGERLGVVNSYRTAYGRMPQTRAEWLDVVKIGNGRFPGEISATSEANAKARFRLIYLREPNMSINLDANAVVVMAYGLRPLPRNLNSEAQAQVYFRGIFGHIATSATDWDAVRAIAYSGATR